jgi:hypothetical protein
MLPPVQIKNSGWLIQQYRAHYGLNT